MSTLGLAASLVSFSASLYTGKLASRLAKPGGVLTSEGLLKARSVLTSDGVSRSVLTC